MSYVRFENVSKAFGGTPVLDAISLRVEEGEKIGLIGRNGSGKTTLFRLITGECEPDSGIIERMRRARVACLAQLPRFDPETAVIDVVMESFRALLEREQELARMEHQLAADPPSLKRYGELQHEFEMRGGYEFRVKARQVLTGLGFAPEEFNLPVIALSGGQRTRLMLALVLLQDADLLLLDEPENHLDIDARQWLEGFLSACRQAVIIISHDRRMLNKVVSRVIEVDRARLTAYSGNYDFYLKHRTLIRDQQQREFELQQELIEKEQKWINRFRYKETKARQVQSRIKRLERLPRVEPPPPQAADVRIRFREVVRSGQLVLAARNLSMQYGALSLYSGLNLEVTRGERVGVIGPNGCGKTTLIKHLAGRIDGGRGEVAVGHKVQIGLYDQHHEHINTANDIFSEIRRYRPDLTPEQVRTFMGALLFTGDLIFKPISGLSGGELSRLALAKLILSNANLLLLDEPTNHLDIAGREALESALAEFPGTLVIISHDRELIDRLVDKLVVFEKGNAAVHLGNYSHYLWKTGNRGAPPLPTPQKDVLKIRKQSPRNRTPEREQRKKTKLLEEIERDIDSLEQLIRHIEQQFVQMDPSDYEQARALNEQYEGLKNDLRDMYADWEKLAE